MTIRRKTITLDGASVVIGSLTFKQIEEGVVGKPIDTFEVVALSLNNIAIVEQAEARWNREELQSEFDTIFLNHLLTEIFEFNGLALKDKQGESPAAAPAEPA